MFSITGILYIIIIITTTICAKLSQHNVKGLILFRWKWLFVAFLIHWFFCAFTNIGIDYERYHYIISFDCQRRLSNGEEIGFNGLSYLLYRIFKNADFCIFLYKTISLIIFYYGFYLLRRSALLWMVFLAFNVHTYFAGYYIIAMQLSISLIFLSAIQMVIYNKRVMPFILAVTATTIHTSAIMMVLCYLVIFALNIKNKKMGYVFLFIMLVVLFITLSYAKTMFSYALSNYEFFSDYEQYEESNQSGGSGYFNYILYIIFLLYVIPLLKCNLPSYVINSIMVFYGFSFLFSIMGYLFGIARLNSYNVVFLEVAIPFIFYQEEIAKVKISSPFDMNAKKAIWMFYLIFLGTTSLKKYVSSDSVNMMNEWLFYSPF